jgi:ABC-type transport system involved in multi-copper enzyme maturation permease subunit
MKPVLLIAVNFVREQRWPILVLLLWVLLLMFLGLVTDLPRQREDLLFIFKQVAVYVVAFSIFFGGSAIYSERKSRRILAVLSKDVARHQYLSGLVIGVTLACGIYCFSLGLTGSWSLGQNGFPVSEVWFLMACLVAASMLAGTVALMFSTFLNPFFAAGATAIVLGMPVVLGHTLSPHWVKVIPAYELTITVMQASFHPPASFSWGLIALAVGETFVFWMFSAWIFSRVDLAVAVE